VSAEQDAAARLAQEIENRRADAGRRAPLRRERNKEREQHDPDAVVKQRLAFHFGLQRFRQMHVAQRAQHRDRIGRAD
jgi:hypothetical protein